MYTIEREQKIQCTLQEAWRFFSTPKNLSKITPPAMNFKIMTNVPDDIHEGLKIMYRVTPLPLFRTKWVSEITTVEKERQFVDMQLTGPYRVWIHTHIFEPTDDGKVLMKDKVEYALPMGFLGKLAHQLFVRKKLENIFSYRFKAVEERFNKK